LAKSKYQEKESEVGSEVLRRIERDVMLQIVDSQWKDHLYGLDHLKEGIGLRGYGQRNPLVEYKRESFALFQAMKERIDEETVKYLWRLRPIIRDPSADVSRKSQTKQTADLVFNNPSEGASTFTNAGRQQPRPARTGGDDAAVSTIRREMPKVGRNAPCPCGSGKKYKKCHGA